jgi:PTS system nitrogen regulatory IIA component
VAFDAPDGKSVSLLVFLLVPEQATQQHLEILSELAEMLSDRAMRDTLLTQADPKVIHQALEAWQPARA